MVLDIISFINFYPLGKAHGQSQRHFMNKIHYGLYIKSFGQKKSNFMHEFKSAILIISQFCQNITFEPVHEIQNFSFGQKHSFEAL